MNTSVSNAISAVANRAAYDECAKSLLAHKIILAYILVQTVDELKGCNPWDVVSCIEGEPYIGSISTEPGQTNGTSEWGILPERRNTTQKIVGSNTEDTEINEGTIRFDIIFYVRLPDGLTQIILNVEIQKDQPSGYKILNRSIYYVCRMISSQKERDFQGMNFDDIKRVTSIWICMNMDTNSMTDYHLTKEDFLEPYE